MIAWGIESLFASALLMALVLGLRGPVRRAFGAQVAYALWALPVLRVALPPLPAMWRETVAMPIADIGRQMTVLIAPVGDRPAASAASYVDFGAIFAVAWCVGAVSFLAWHFAAYARFRRRILSSAREVDRVNGVTIVETAAAAGPLAFGIARRFVAFPSDFAARYDADERALALAHELGHHARGDLVANWFALAVLALHWFNPLAWFAFRAFRADQEMANDARVLAGRSAAERHAYACAVVKSANGGAISAACHLHTVNDLKGRLKMLANHAISRERLLTGSAAVALLTLAGLGLTASGTQAAETMRSGVEQATGLDLATLTPAASSATPAAATKRDTRVVIVRDGRTTTYDGAAADAYIAANPVPVPPVPPVPPPPSVPAVAPIPPVPPVPAEAGAWSNGRHVVVRSEDCAPIDDAPTVLRTRENGRDVTIICANRIERMANRAAEHAVESAKIAHYAQVSALKGLRTARAGLARSPGMPAEARADALASIDESIADIEEELRDAQ